MSKIKLPKHIVESNFGSVPKEYEAFVYRFTNLDDNKKYVGYHKGYVGDGLTILPRNSTPFLKSETKSL